MRNYELAYIAHPELDETELKALEERVTGWVDAAGGKIVKVDRWGKRRLAYAIAKQNDGHYFIIDVEMPPEAGVVIERDLRLSEQILRFMITLQDRE
ncbi:MAG: 30S ribosomal protein S6 [Anaerolineales bacterium]|jgi:small subunit ribosomal protein S6